MTNYLKQIADEKLIDRDDIDYIPTGLKALDEFLDGGIPTGVLTVLSSSEGSGKTTLTTQIAGYAADRGIKTMIYSGEMSGGATLNTMIRQIAGPRWTSNYLMVSGIPQKTVPYVPEETENYIKEKVLRDNVFFLNSEDIKSWTNLQDAMEAGYRAGVKLFIIDNLMTLTALFGGDRNNNGTYGTDQYYQQTGAVGFLNTYAIGRGCAVILVAHTKKGGNMMDDEGNDGIFGTSAVKNLAGLVIRFIAPTANEMAKFNTKAKEESKEEGVLKPLLESQNDRLLMITKNRIGGQRKNLVVRYQPEYFRYFDDSMVNPEPEKCPNVYARITRFGFDYGMAWEAGYYKMISQAMMMAGAEKVTRSSDAVVDGCIGYYKLLDKKKQQRLAAKQANDPTNRRESAYELYCRGCKTETERAPLKDVNVDEFGKLVF